MQDRPKNMRTLIITIERIRRDLQPVLDPWGTVEFRLPPQVDYFLDMMHYLAIALGFIKSSLDNEEPAKGADFRQFVRKGAGSLQAFDKWHKPRIQLSHFLKWK
ncbi:MAG: hypothetical protein M1822_006477 [Bathelium mastoideum]|nr:MAG: hypothetical protein M1822_006477 [Bathelium mastoideum]